MNPRYQRGAVPSSDSDFSSAPPSVRDNSSSSSGSTVPSSTPSSNFHSKKLGKENQKPVDPRATVDTYRSTTESIQEFHDTYPAECFQQPLIHDATPADPQQFGLLFPSSRSFIIKHDESSVDSHMNLRFDTLLTGRSGRRDRKVTLFYLRMYDLASRHFAVRRYGRDCGREVCHSKRKYQSEVAQRPVLQRGMSKALQSFRGKQDMQAIQSLKRQDSACSSSDEDEPKVTKDGKTETNTCILEFSNYAHVDVSRKGVKASKKYDFEYWGSKYSWRRTIRKDGSNDATVFTLVNTADGATMASIAPLEDDSVSDRDQALGRFVPACEFSFNVPDKEMRRSSFADLADVIVSTGLMALVDDCLKRKTPKVKKTVSFALPVPSKTPMKLNLEYIGPKRMYEELFNRQPSTPKSRPSSIIGESRPTAGRSYTAPVQPTRQTPIRAYTSPDPSQYSPKPLRAY
ncbi:hypothetical protein BJ508DRAFT_320578 [Ascobolus immersus RN42]|uniref:Uncharacterized protein n=1 Tax=Ascobolus immersus RN42 TaxID=1160509 RepID=A0A3N4ITI6_ASCIM|nr:hypothetical protein BJ508DRAFT_320578 [Ascobolus immersus RN42]